MSDASIDFPIEEINKVYRTRKRKPQKNFLL